MNHKDVAKELIDKYLIILTPTIELGSSHEQRMLYVFEQAKQCALNTIDEILQAIPMYIGNLNPTWKFYSEVKEELENMKWVS